MDYSETIENIKKDLRANLSDYRYTHVESVVETAIGLATVIRATCADLLSLAEIEKIRVAGYLHDYAKEMSGDEMLTLAEYHGIKIYDEDRAAPILLHARVGAALAEEKFEIYDPFILDAVKHHTFGAPDMGLSSKILFLADFVEPGRDAKLKDLKSQRGVEDYRTDLDEVRDMLDLGAASDAVDLHAKLDRAILRVMDLKIEHVLKKEQPLHPLGIEARNAFVRS